VELLRIRGGKLSDRGAYLHLQDHGDPVWYRNIKLRVIGKDEKLERSDVTPMPIPEASLKYEKEFVEKALKRRKGGCGRHERSATVPRRARRADAPAFPPAGGGVRGWHPPTPRPPPRSGEGEPECPGAGGGHREAGALLHARGRVPRRVARQAAAALAARGE